MFKLKVRKGTKVILKSRGITIDGNQNYNQSVLENWYNLGLTNYVSKSKKKKDEENIND